MACELLACMYALLKKNIQCHVQADYKLEMKIKWIQNWRKMRTDFEQKTN